MKIAKQIQIQRPSWCPLKEPTIGVVDYNRSTLRKKPRKVLETVTDDTVVRVFDAFDGTLSDRYIINADMFYRLREFLQKEAENNATIR